MERKTYFFGGMTLDPQASELRDSSGGAVPLQPQPYDVLRLLVEASGQLVSHAQLRQAIWGDTIVEYDQGIYFCIRQIRRALTNHAPGIEFVETVPRRGYRLAVDVKTPPVHNRVPLRWTVAAGLAAVATVSFFASARNLVPPTVVPEAIHAYRLAESHLANNPEESDLLKADSLLSRALEYDPTFNRARARLAYVMLEKRYQGATPDPKADVSHWIAGAELDDPAWILVKGYDQFLSGDLEAAAVTLEELVSNDNAPQETFMLLGRVFNAQGDRVNALRYMRMGLWRTPNSRPLATGVAEAYRELGDTENADRFFELAAEI